MRKRCPTPTIIESEEKIDKTVEMEAQIECDPSNVDETSVALVITSNFLTSEAFPA
jgi:hypothetical protein